MANIKTAISIEKELFMKIDHLSHELKVPRSRLFSLGMNEYIARLETQRLREQINAAWADGLDESEKRWLDAASFNSACLVDDQW